MPLRALVTGINGFTGRYIAPALLQRGYEVHGLSTVAAIQSSAYVSHVGDLLDTTSLIRVIEEVRPNVVINLAGVSFVPHSSVDTIYQTNLIGSRNLLEALTQSGVFPSAVLLASSANVYGNSTEGVMDETTPPAPANDYAVSKLAMEHVAKLYKDRLPIIIVRPFNYTGVGQSPTFLLPKIVDHIRRRAEHIELGNLDVARDFSDVRMVVDAYCRLLEEPSAIGGTYNVCSGIAYTLGQVLELAQQISGHHMVVSINPSFVRANEVKMLLGSRSRLESRIGSVQPHKLLETLRWMINN
ncbi:GDP-mannose 4,6-dehydratase [Limnohabitans sp. MMS-10A-178]|uniref:GDP-mannose 4,6-dehydratase n=1 Tax=Limnohabitans sp. MMS-10A-178 TaxID=1835767 RepID=UPI000D39A6DC|nr:GDP-mannose 4,6-dehydratase [Limnohabitans sp. MMS-10A-178]PUE16069.1 GDP-mannose 4,6 dehydratase [Limnohabitans sp. MMS-10A-178]